MAVRLWEKLMILAHETSRVGWGSSKGWFTRIRVRSSLRLAPPLPRENR
ncbi:hypothetical protein Isop_2787 [Isosphaera pallida ATCC 43644]|uniref:Uncharacterized protein n=1 Tax=Isosphaera pallida (strain ATCC 43644 / DSM 9630 / IS1B) TaxID=575540 RepID=E8R102_ISOPI|nr:hypothetical protein Isop_2787 [Isosphaera pallida ATCC 43644]